MALTGKAFEKSLIKQKGATLAQINEHLYELEVFAKSLKRITFTDADLTETLAEGVGNILAGVGQNYILSIKNDYILAQHKDAVYNTTIGAYTGDLRTALFIGANGIGMGNNRKSDGAWVNTVAIDGTTGDASFLGTLTAGSIISGSTTINSSGGESITSVQNKAQSGYNIQYQLEVTGTTVLRGVVVPTDSGALKTGSITWNATTGALTGGSGVAITEWGIIGAASGVPTFTIDATTGAATFAGDIETAGEVYAQGNTSSPSLGVSACIVGEANASNRRGVIGSAAHNSSGSVGVQGYSAFSYGGVFTNNVTTVGALLCSCNAGSTGIALEINVGRIQKSNVAGHFLSVYDSGTNALVATYRYQFHA